MNNTTHRDVVLASHIAVNVINALVRKLEKRLHLGCSDFVCRFDSYLGYYEK